MNSGAIRLGLDAGGGEGDGERDLGEALKVAGNDRFVSGLVDGLVDLTSLGLNAGIFGRLFLSTMLTGGAFTIGCFFSELSTCWPVWESCCLSSLTSSKALILLESSRSGCESSLASFCSSLGAFFSSSYLACTSCSSCCCFFFANSCY